MKIDFATYKYALLGWLILNDCNRVWSVQRLDIEIDLIKDCFNNDMHPENCAVLIYNFEKN